MDTGDNRESIIEQPRNTNKAHSAGAATTWNSLSPEDQPGVSFEARGKARSKPSIPRLPSIHTKSDFAIDATLILDLTQPLQHAPMNARKAMIAASEQPPTLRYVPVHAKISTTCDYNLISTKMLDRAGIKDGDIPELAEPAKLDGLDGTTHTLRKKITFTWCLNRNMRSRVDEFYIVENDAFDVVLGSRDWGGFRANVDLILASDNSRGKFVEFGN